MTDRRRAVLLHDVAGSAATWWRIGPALAAAGWETLAMDLPAHGTKPMLDRPLDMLLLVNSVVKELPGRADLLVGHGFGGVLALTLAGRYGDIARAVVVEDPPVGGTISRDALIRQILLESAFSRADPEGLTTRLLGANPDWTDLDLQRTIADLSAADVPSIVAGLRSRMTWDLPALVASLRMPLLMVVASDDPIDLGAPGLPGRSALRGPDRKEVRNQLPTQHFVELAGGHYLHRDRPKEWLTTVTTFADSVLAP